MNLLQAINKEHSATQRNKIVRYVGKDPKRFALLVDIFLAGPYRTTQRASWPLSACAEHHPELAKPHLKRLIKNLKQPGLHDAVKRNTVRLLQFVEIPKSLQGEVANICFDFLGGTTEALAVKVFSMSVLAQIALHQPELKNELIPIIEDQMPYASPAFRSRGTKTLRALRKL